LELSTREQPITMSVTAEPTDSELVDRMASGDREAFAAVFRRHQATIYRFSRQMLGSREAAEDVTQDVFIALAQTARRFDPSVASLTTYLYGIARNLILHRNRRSRAHLEVDIGSVASEDSPAMTTAPDQADALSRAEMVGRLRLVIVRLPVHYREVVVLCELNGLSYEEAATISGCPVGTIRSRLSRARQILIERCRALLIPDMAEGRVKRAESTRAESVKRTESIKKWLIPTKNDC
jgi:RNA polymerase sigma factor (sigma-70 family)